MLPNVRHGTRIGPHRDRAHIRAPGAATDTAETKRIRSIDRSFYSPDTIAPWKMDRGRIMARQLVDIVSSTAVQCSVEDRIFDNCRDRLHNRASFGFSRVAVETIEPTHRGKPFSTGKKKKRKKNTHTKSLFAWNAIQFGRLLLSVCVAFQMPCYYGPKCSV